MSAVYLTVMQSGCKAPGVEPDEVAGSISRTIWQGDAGLFLAQHGADPDTEGYRDDRYIVVCPTDEVEGRLTGEIASMLMEVTGEELAAVRAAMRDNELAEY